MEAREARPQQPGAVSCGWSQKTALSGQLSSPVCVTFAESRISGQRAALCGSVVSSAAQNSSSSADVTFRLLRRRVARTGGD